MYFSLVLSGTANSNFIFLIFKVYTNIRKFHFADNKSAHFTRKRNTLTPNLPATSSRNPNRKQRAHNAFAICLRLHRNTYFDCASSIPTGILSMPFPLPPFWLNRHLVLIKLPKKRPLRNETYAVAFSLEYTAYTYLNFQFQQKDSDCKANGF